jgi:hypothetical protein
MQYFLCKLIPPRPAFNMDMSPDEAAAMKEHSIYWNEKAKEGIAIAVGPVADPSGVWGVAICELPDGQSMEEITAADPVNAKIPGTRWEVYPMPGIILRK